MSIFPVFLFSLLHATTYTKKVLDVSLWHRKVWEKTKCLPFLLKQYNQVYFHWFYFSDVCFLCYSPWAPTVWCLLGIFSISWQQISKTSWSSSLAMRSFWCRPPFSCCSGTQRKAWDKGCTIYCKKNIDVTISEYVISTLQRRAIVLLFYCSFFFVIHLIYWEDVMDILFKNIVYFFIYVFTKTSE